MTRIAFTADLHVDAYGTKLDRATGLNARLTDYLETLAWVATEARRRQCDALVVAGDFTERRHPAPWLVAKIREALSEGPERQFYLRGNHDGEIDGRSIVSLLGTFHDGVHRTRIERLDFGDVTLAFIPYLDRHWLRAQPGFEAVPDAELYGVLAEQFLAVARGLYAEATGSGRKQRAIVLVCHQTLAGAAMSDTQQAFLGDLSLVVDARALHAIGFEAVVAGHLHRHQVVVPGDRPVLYTGSIERVDFGEEHEAKGFIVADVSPGHFDWEFVETPARRFVTLRGDEVLHDWDVANAIVRCLDVPPEVDVAVLRQALEANGAFEITEIRRRPPERTEAAGGLSESLTAHQALEAYFDPLNEPDHAALVELGRSILEAVS